ncbi:hypothetical protein RHSIM_Rhsim02G0189700 [Rhododendron simsii]|uniref:Chromo domain-containing protein n=1 Tax=Rhododendron simsii TaxID=118357 RepID=A0A834HDB9_RHOSS|nr:hypothetical protein RHSIM_Rhsim02G0189700 [Rhododendron simsii]
MICPQTSWTVWIKYGSDYDCFASTLYLSAVKANAPEKVESELLDLVEASKRSPSFAQFMKDLTVPKVTRIKALTEICADAKLSDVTRNFLCVVATSTLPPVNEEGNMQIEPVAVLERKMVKRNNRVVVQWLVQWSRSFPEDATWIDYEEFLSKFPNFQP